jgi:hypothetical protein
MGNILLVILATVTMSNVDNPAKAYLNENVQIAKNAETGLTDFAVFGKEFSLDIVESYEVNE